MKHVLSQGSQRRGVEGRPVLSSDGGTSTNGPYIAHVVS